MSTKKRANQSVKDDIREAVDKLPDMFQPPSAPVNSSRRHIHRLMLWSGVTLLTVIIFGMWLWNAETVLYDLSHQKSREGQIVDNAKKDVSTIFKNFSKANEEAQIKQSIRQALADETAKANDEKEVRAAMTKVLGEKIATTTKD